MKEILKRLFVVVLLFTMVMSTYANVYSGGEVIRIEQEFNEMINSLKSGDFNLAKKYLIGVDLNNVKLDNSIDGILSAADSLNEFVNYGLSLAPHGDDIGNFINDNDPKRDKHAKALASVMKPLNFSVDSINKVNDNRYEINIIVSYPVGAYYEELYSKINKRLIDGMGLTGIKQFLGKVMPLSRLVLGETNPFDNFETLFIDVHNELAIDNYQYESTLIKLDVDYDYDEFYFRCNSLFKKSGDDYIFNNKDLKYVCCDIYYSSVIRKLNTTLNDIGLFK